MVVAILLVIVLSFVVMVRLALRESQLRVNLARARANAKVGVVVAISELQKHAGADQRVTATADLFSKAATNPTSLDRRYLTGVWDSAETLPSGAPNPGYGHFLGWLASGADLSHSNAAARDAIRTTPSGGDEILLVGSGSADADVDPTNPNPLEVRVPKVPLYSGGSSALSHYFAWWVGDEGVKARINLADERKDSSTETVVNSVLTAPSRSGTWLLTDLEAYSDLDAGILQRMNSIADVPLALNDPGNSAAKKFFFDLSTVSSGVLTDARNGGLKRDLSLAFEMSDNDFDTSWFGTGSPFPPLDENGDYIWNQSGVWGGKTIDWGRPVSFLFRKEVPSSERISNNIGPTLYGPTWQVLRHYYNIYKNMDRSGATPGYIAHGYFPNHQQMLELATASGVPRGSAMHEFWNVSSMFSADQDPETTPNGVRKSHGNVTIEMPEVYQFERPNIGPVVVRQFLLVSFQTAPHWNDAGKLEGRIIMNPVFVVHNPYNVNLKVRRMAISITQITSIMLEFSSNQRFPAGHYPHEPYMPDTNNDYTQNYKHDLGTSLQGFQARLWDLRSIEDPAFDGAQPYSRFMNLEVDFQGSMGEFAPGEVKILSVLPDVHGDPLPLVKGQVKLKEGYDPAGGFYFPLIALIKNMDNPTNQYAAKWVTIPYDDNDEITFSHNLSLRAGALLAIDSTGDEALMDDDPGFHRDYMGSVMSRMEGQISAAFVEGGQDTINNPGSLTRRADQWAIPTPLYAWEVLNLTPGDYEAGRSGGSRAFPPYSRMNPLAVTQQRQTVASKTFNDATPGIMPWWRKPAGFTDVIQNDGGRAYWGPSKEPSTSYPVMLELPTSPLLSLGQLQHANIAKLGYQPSLAISNSFASPWVRADKTMQALVSGSQARLAYDISYLANETLWDGYFFSSISPESSSYGDAVNRTIDQVVQDFVDGSGTLRNPRHVPAKGIPIQDLQSRLSDFRTAAAGLNAEGMFNVNSVSAKAWAAVLGSDKGTPFYYEDSGLQQADAGFPADHQNTRIGRLTRPTAADRGNDYYDHDAWGGMASLTDDQVNILAEKVVELIQERASRLGRPVLSLSEFVNRELPAPLPSTVPPEAKAGLLQRAIDETSINDMYDEFKLAPEAWKNSSNYRLGASAVVPYSDNLYGSTGSGAAGFVLQGDVLQKIGSIIAVRSDTFVVRAYGEVLNESTGKTEAAAWCEAVVQRTPEPLEPGAADPNDPAAELNPSDQTAQTFGRKYRIVRFRWLSEDDI